MSFQPVAFPLFNVVAGDPPTCACGFVGCTRVGKHPAVEWRDLAVGMPVERPVDGAGYGIKTGAAPKGSGVIVVDLDGEEACSSWDALGGAATRTVKTGRKQGEHLYFVHPGFPVRNSKGLLAPKIDIRGDGGFVVGPGSPHASGETYALLTDEDTSQDPAPCPAWLVEWLRKQPAPAEVQPHVNDVTDPAERDHRRDLYTTYLKSAVPCVQGSGGDEHLFEVVQVGAYDLALPSEDVLTLIEEHFEPRCTPPWGDELEERVLHKAHTAKTKSTRPRNEPLPSPKADPLLASFFAPSTMPASTPAANDTTTPPTMTENTPLPAAAVTLGGLDFQFGGWEDEPPPTEFLIDGLLPKGSVSMLFGRADSLKTWLLYDAAIAMARGTPWLGRGTRAGGVKVGIVDYETGGANVKRRMFRLRAGNQQNLGTAVFPKGEKPNEWAFWVKLAKHDFDVVIVDSLRRANPGAQENDNGEAIVPLELAAEFSERTGCAVIFIHHAKKSTADGWPEFRGASGIEDQVDCSFAVRKVDFESPEVKRVEVKCIKPGDMRMPEPFAVEVRFDDTARKVTIVGTVLETVTTGKGDAQMDPAVARAKHRAALLLALDSAERAGERVCSKSRIRDLLECGQKASDATLDEAVKAGEVTDLGRGKGYIVDDDGRRRARVRESIVSHPHHKTAAALAKVAKVDTEFVEAMQRAKSISFSQEGRWLVLPAAA